MAVNEQQEATQEAIERGIQSYRLRVQENITNLKDSVQRGSDATVIERELQKTIGHLTALYALQMQHVDQELKEGTISQRQLEEQKRLLQDHFAEEVGLLSMITEEVLNA